MTLIPQCPISLSDNSKKCRRLGSWKSNPGGNIFWLASFFWFLFLAQATFLESSTKLKAEPTSPKYGKGRLPQYFLCRDRRDSWNKPPCCRGEKKRRLEGQLAKADNAWHTVPFLFLHSCNRFIWRTILGTHIIFSHEPIDKQLLGRLLFIPPYSGSYNNNRLLQIWRGQFGIKPIN